MGGRGVTRGFFLVPPNGADRTVNGAHDTSISRFTITGPGGGGCDSLEYGVRVDGGGSAGIAQNHITKIEDMPFSGCQNGVAVQVGRANPPLDDTTGSAAIRNNLIDNYQKNGVTRTPPFPPPPPAAGPRHPGRARPTPPPPGPVPPHPAVRRQRPRQPATPATRPADQPAPGQPGLREHVRRDHMIRNAQHRPVGSLHPTAPPHDRPERGLFLLARTPPAKHTFSNGAHGHVDA